MKRRIFFALLVLAVGACGGDATGPEGVAGTYNLVSIDGDPLPFVLEQSTNFREELTAGHISINADLTCSFSLTIKETEFGTVSTETETEPCTYILNNTAIAINFNGSTASGSIVGSSLTLADDGFVFIFEK